MHLQGVVGLAAVGGACMVDYSARQAACRAVPQVRLGEVHRADQLPANLTALQQLLGLSPHDEGMQGGADRILRLGKPG